MVDIDALNDLSETEAEAYSLWVDGGYGTDVDTFQDAYRGLYDSVTDYASELVDDCYDLERTMGNLSAYFDYEAFGRDLEIGGDIWSERSTRNCGVHIFDNI